jgi:hypothetical protein
MFFKSKNNTIAKPTVINVNNDELDDNFTRDVIPIYDKHITIYTHKQNGTVYMFKSCQLIPMKEVFPYNKLSK